MTITLAMFASLSAYQPDGQGGRHARPIDLAEGSSIGDLARLLGLPDAPRIVFVDGHHADDDHILAEGERVAIFPPVAGG